MKRILLTFLPVFLALAVFAQSDRMDRQESPVENGPVIININGHKADLHTIDRNFSEYDEEIVGADDQLRSDGLDEQNTANQDNSGQTNAGMELRQNELEAINSEEEEQDIVEEVRSELKVYPIPAVTDLQVDFGQEVEVEVSLMNIIGQEVFSNSGEMRKLSISVSDFTSGTYFLMISIDNDRITKRVQIR